ncbi:MAG: methionine--tRNA ligase [Candidatus Woesearchaeota archaeon]
MKYLNLVDNLKGFKKVMVTSALPYVNYEPHLGHLAGAVLSADVFYKYLKIKGVESIYICGTDENGTTTEVTAKKEDMKPIELCNKYHKIHKEIYEGFGIDFTYFGRTTSETQKEVTRSIFKKAKENGYIVEKEAKQAYCPQCEIELADRYVMGTCPHCEYEDATGGQCESCGKLLEPNELLEPKCSVCGTKPKFELSKHLYLDLPQLENELIEFVESKERWSDNAVEFSLNMINDLKPRAISRKINWGIKIPEYDDLVFYVWFDAPIGYISMTKEGLKETEDNYERWWNSPDDTRLVQFMGKDNIPFHTIVFPAELMATNDNWTLVDTLSSTEYLNYEGKKFSKSKRIGIFGKDAIKSDIPSDYWRFYIMSIRPEKSDTNFNLDEFEERINNGLVSNTVNFCYRVLSLTSKYFDDEIPEFNTDSDLMSDVFQKVNEMDELMDEVKIKQYIKKILELSSIGNKYLQENKPWKLINKDEDAVKDILGNSIQVVKILSMLLYPITPDLSTRLKDMLLLDEKDYDFVWSNLEKDVIGKINVEKIANRIDNNIIEEMKEKYSENEFSKLNLKVGKIIDVKDIEHTDKLYKVIVDLGDEKRQLVAGLKKHFTIDEMLGQFIVVVTNLEPAKLAGVKSEGMLLACETKDEVKLLTVSNPKAGMQIFVDGVRPTNDKISFKEFLKLTLELDDSKVHYKGSVLKTKKGIVTCDVEDENGAKIR